MQPSTNIHKWRGEPALSLEADGTTATFLPGLGMLGVSLSHDGQELLALPGGLGAYRDGHVTGLPLLAPWANRLSRRSYRAAGVDVDLGSLDLNTDGNGLPIHGTMTGQPSWRIAAVTTRDRSASVRATFDYGAHPDLLAAFPFPHELTLDATVDGASLRVETTLRPTGAMGVPVSFGYHPYLALPDAPRGSWLLAMPDRHHLALDERGIPTGVAHDETAEHEPLGTRTFDDGYALGRDRRFSIEGPDRHVWIDFDDGYPFAQVFAPPRRHFVCLEPMTAMVDALVTGEHPVVAPGHSFTAVFTIGFETAR